MLVFEAPQVIFWKWRKAKGISSFDGSACARCWVSCSAHSRLDAMLGLGRLSFCVLEPEAGGVARLPTWVLLLVPTGRVRRFQSSLISVTAFQCKTERWARAVISDFLFKQSTLLKRNVMQKRVPPVGSGAKSQT